MEVNKNFSVRARTLSEYSFLEVQVYSSVNEKLWIIEDAIRSKEKNKEFDEEFIELARSVYFTNDERFVIKNKINNETGSLIQEQKSYEEYQ